MSIVRYVNYIDDNYVQQFNVQSNPPFPSTITYYAIRNKRKIDVGSFGFPRSVLGTEVLYSNQKTDSKIVNCTFSPDGIKLICVTETKHGFLYDLTQSPTKPPIKFAQDIVQACFVDDDNFVFSNVSCEIFESSVTQPNSRKKISNLPPCTVNSIDQFGNSVFYSTSIGIFLDGKRIFNTESYACTESDEGDIIYFLTTTGFVQYEFETQEIKPLLNIDKMLRYLHCEKLQLANMPLCFFNNYLVICTEKRALAFNITNDLLGPMYIQYDDEDGPLLGVLVDQNNSELSLITSTKPIYLSFPPYKQSDYAEKPRFVTKLAELLKKIKESPETDIFNFTDISDLLKAYPDQYDLLIPMLLDSYCKLPPSTSNEIFPLLLHTLKKHKGSISFDLIYEKLLASGRESEVWRFLLAFDSVEEELLLRCIRSCKLSPKEIIPLIERCDPKDINAADITYSFPELASTVYKVIGDASAPFVLPHLSEIDNETLQSMKSGSGSVVEIRISEQLHEKPSFTTNNNNNNTGGASNQQGNNSSNQMTNSSSYTNLDSNQNSKLNSILSPNAPSQGSTRKLPRSPSDLNISKQADQLLMPSPNLSNFSSPMFYLLETAKYRGDWTEAAQISAELDFDEEVKFCKSKMSNSADDIRAKLLKANLDVSEINEILMQLITELENAPPGKTFEDYSLFAKSITKRIDTEIKNAGEKRQEESTIIDELTRQRAELRDSRKRLFTNAPPPSTETGGSDADISLPKTGDRCERCKRPLGRGRVVMYRCGHCYHEECRRLEEKEIKEIEHKIRRRPMRIRGCPACGMQSALKVYGNVMNQLSEWSLDI